MTLEHGSPNLDVPHEQELILRDLVCPPPFLFLFAGSQLLSWRWLCLSLVPLSDASSANVVVAVLAAAQLSSAGKRVHAKAARPAVHGSDERLQLVAAKAMQHPPTI